MNILFFTKYYNPHLGGVEKHTKEVAERLAKKGHQVTVITMKHQKQLPGKETRGGVKIFRIPYSTKKISIWKSIWRHIDLIKSSDLVHCHDVFFWYWPFRLIFPLKKVFVTFHGWEGKYPIPGRSILVRKLNETLTNGNICVGKYLLKHYGTKTSHITYGGVDQTINKKNDEAKTITFIGRLEKVNGIEEYLTALKKLKEKHNYKVTFIGDGKYRNQAENLGKVTGMVKDITPYLNQARIVMASSYLSILEAMVAGKPVFALSSNLLKKDYLYMFPGAKYINISSSSVELVKQIETNLQGWTLKVKKGQEFSKKQTWDKVVNLYLKLWKIS